MTKKKQKQISFKITPIQAKRFSIDSMVKAKLDHLSTNIKKLKYNDLVWLSKIEDFFFKYEYLTEKQVRVLDTIFDRNCY